MNKSVVAVIATAIVAGSVGFGAGFLSGVFSTDFGKEMFEAVVAFEEPAEVSKTINHDQNRFTFRYPGNWKIDDKSEHFDPEYCFSIDSPGGNYLSFEFANVELSESDKINDWKDFFDKLLNIRSEESFVQWGSYQGTGLKIFATYLGEPVQVRLFCYSGDDCCFTVSEYFDSIDSSNVQPGFQLIENSFELKEIDSQESQSGENDQNQELVSEQSGTIEN